MKLVVNRYRENEQCTISYGYLYDDSGEELASYYFLEPKGEDCVIPNQNKRIPEGIYNCDWVTSTQAGHKIKGKLPLIYNDKVAKSRRIRMHIGNYPKDTKGCLLIGTRVGENAVFDSKKALTSFLDFTFEKELEIEINNVFGEEK